TGTTFSRPRRPPPASRGCGCSVRRFIRPGVAAPRGPPSGYVPHCTGSAPRAPAKGLPYVFAHHFPGQGTEEALAVYRSQFVPSELAAEPVTFVTVNAAVAETHDEATALMLPNLHMMARLRTGQPLGPLELVEDSRGAQLTLEQQRIVRSGLDRA